MESELPVKIKYRTPSSSDTLEYTTTASEEELAGLWIGILVLSDLNVEVARSRLSIIPTGTTEKVWNPTGVLMEYLVDFKGTVLTVTLDPKVNTKIMVKKKNVVLLTGPQSFAVAQFDKINFLKGVVIACKLMKEDFRNVITRYVNWETGQKMELK